MSGARIDRRTLLQAGAAGVLVAALGGCGDGEEPGEQARAVAGRSIALDYASYYPPAERLRELASARARERGALLTLSDDAAGAAAQQRAFSGYVSERGGFRALVVAPFDAAALAPLTADAVERGVAVVSYGIPLSGATATIAADPTPAARLLARDVGAWAGGDDAEVLIVRPPERSPTPDQFAPRARPWEAALLAELERRAPALRPVAATTAQAAADAQAAVARALVDYPRVRVVLAWNDSAAVAAAQALRAANPRARWPRLYAGGVGAPAIATAASLEALRDDPVLRCLVAPRLADLADALVDVPYALLRRRPAPAAPPLVVLRKGEGGALAAFARDYA